MTILAMTNKENSSVHSAQWEQVFGERLSGLDMVVVVVDDDQPVEVAEDNPTVRYFGTM